MEPEIIISTVDQPVPKVTPFSSLYDQKKKITRMTFLWNYNSYHIDIPEKYFIINGGRKIRFEEAIQGDIQILYAKRNRVSFSMGSGSSNGVQTAYLLGAESADKKIILLIDEDGSSWSWQDHR